MEILTPGNFVAYGIQVLCVAALATVLAVIVRVDSAAVRYAYWRVVLATSLLLPWVQPLREGTAATSSAAGATAAAVSTIVGPADGLQPSSGPAADWFALVTIVLVAGAAARLIWVAAGIVSLRRLRGLGDIRCPLALDRCPSPIGADHADASLADSYAAFDQQIAELQQTLRTRAEIRYVPGLTQPATFGLRRPVVLLPEAADQQPLAIQRAVLAHELIHVQRRDWMWVVCEELLLAAFWFNPGMWWIVAQVRRTREEAVDEYAVAVTGSRRTYVKALLAFAEDAPLTPAPAFAHRRHLFRRITLISREAAMSSNRIVLSCAVMALVLATGSWYAAGAFPLTEQAGGQIREEPGPLESRANPVTAQNPVPRRTDYEAADYPVEARSIGAAGSVTLRITLDEVGRVAEARRTRFSISAQPPGVSRSIGASFGNTSRTAVEEALLKSHGRDNTEAILRAVDAMTAAASNAVTRWRYEPPVAGPLVLDVTVHFKNDGETTALQHRGVAGTPLQHRGVAGTAVSSSLDATGAVRVGGNIKPPTKITDVRPVYPPDAMAAGVSGMVIIEARIGKDGTVEEAWVLRSIPMLDQAALDAVRQWRFTPTLMNGVPVPVIMTVTVNFTLQ